MKSIIKRLTSIFYLTSVLLIFFSTSAFAVTQQELKEISGYLNGVVTQNQVNQVNKPQFADRYGVSEFIDPMTGSLTLKATDLFLPGKDGLDLNITRIYNSSMAEYGTKRVEFIASGYTSAPEYVTGWYITLTITNDNGSFSYKLGMFDTYQEAYDLYGYYVDQNNQVIGENYYPTMPQYASLQASQFTEVEYAVNHVNRDNYLHSRYDLGAGWAFAFPSIEILEEDTDYKYFHDGNGGVYRIIFTEDQTDSNLKDYQGKDVQFLTDSGTYNSNGVYSSYKFVESDKRTTYLSSDGRILGIKDRFGNEIKFQHIQRKVHGKYNWYISNIIDSVGRTVDFIYDKTISSDHDGSNETITVIAHDPSNTKTMQVVYTKTKQAINYYTSYGQTADENSDPANAAYYEYFEPQLYSVTDPIGQITYYDIYLNPSRDGDNQTGNYNGGIEFRYDDKILTVPSISPVCLLYRVKYPYSKTIYQWQDVKRNLGKYGAYWGSRMQYRWDDEKRQYNQSWDYYGSINKVTYTYVNDYTGYSQYSDEDTLPESYEISSEATLNANGLKTKTVFNGKKQMIRQEITASNGEKEIIKNLSFDTQYIYKPTRTEVSEYSSSGALLRQLYTDYVYNDWGGLQSETYPLTSAQINDTGIKSKYTITYQYDPVYKFISSKQWYQNDATQCTKSFTYDTLGRVLTLSNANGEVTNYNYPAETATEKIVEITKQLENGKTAKTKVIYGSQSNKAYPNSTKVYYTNDQGVYTEITTAKEYDMMTGLVTSETDAGGKVTSYTYDSIGRPLTVTKPSFANIDGQTYTVRESYEYTDNVLDDSVITDGRKVALFKVKSSTIYTDAQSNSKTYSQTEMYYDCFGNGRLVKAYDDTLGQWVNKGLYTYDSLVRPITYKDAENNLYSYAYDSWGRLSETTDPQGNLQKTEYDIVNKKVTGYFVAQANVASFRADPTNNTYKENVLEVALDQWDRPIERKAFPNWPDTSTFISEKYSYDIVGNLIGYKDPKSNFNEDGNTTTNTYDKLNRLVKLKDALNQLTEVSYNILGNVQNVKMRQNASAQPVDVYTKSYDELGQMTAKTDPMSQSERYVYNALGLNTQRTDKNNTIFTYGYDEYYRVISDKGGNQEYKYLYNNPFGASRVKDFSNSSNIGNADYTYYYDGAVKNKTVSYVGDTFNSALTNAYDNAGKLNSLSINGFYTNYKYDKTRLNKVQTNGQQAEDATGQAYANYEYYPDGKLKKITYPQLSDSTYLTTEYSYNKLNRLTTVTNKKGTTVLSQYSYGYDNNGNITTVTDSTGTTTYVYDKLNRLTEVHRPDGKTIIYSYDLKGNRKTLQDDNPILDIDNVSYTYNVWNQLESVTKGATTTSLKYSPDGLRYKKATPTKTVLYHYNLDGEVIAESDGSNTVTANYVWGSDRALVKKDAATGNQYYYLYNGHGDVVQIVDTNGNVVNNYQYDEWGNITSQTEGIENSFKYAGEQYDSETGLYYLRARYYDPQLGRFINEDTYEGQIDNPLSLNLYTYCYNNAVNLVDPSGHKVAWNQSDNLACGFVVGAYDQYVGNGFGNVFQNIKNAWDSINGLKDLASGIISGDIGIDDLKQIGIDATVGDIKYFIDNVHIITDDKTYSDDQIYEFGKHSAGAYNQVVKIVSTAGGLAKGVKAKIAANTLKNLSGLDDILSNPSILKKITPNELHSYLKNNGYNPQPLGQGSLKGISFEQGGGFKVNWGGDRILQYHPAGEGHHGGIEYWKVSSGKTGTVRYDMSGNIIN